MQVAYWHNEHKEWNCINGINNNNKKKEASALLWISFITASTEALCSEEVEQCQLACRGVASLGRGGCLDHAGGGSVRAYGQVCVCVPSYYVRMARGHCEQKAQKCMASSLPYGLCAALKKRAKALLCNWNQEWTNVGLYVYLPRRQKKTFWTVTLPRGNLA